MKLENNVYFFSLNLSICVFRASIDNITASSKLSACLVTNKSFPLTTNLISAILLLFVYGLSTFRLTSACNASGKSLSILPTLSFTKFCNFSSGVNFTALRTTFIINLLYLWFIKIKCRFIALSLVLSCFLTNDSCSVSTLLSFRLLPLEFRILRPLSGVPTYRLFSIPQ